MAKKSPVAVYGVWKVGAVVVTIALSFGAMIVFSVLHLLKVMGWIEWGSAQQFANWGLVSVAVCTAALIALKFMGSRLK